MYNIRGNVKCIMSHILYILCMNLFHYLICVLSKQKSNNSESDTCSYFCMSKEKSAKLPISHLNNVELFVKSKAQSFVSSKKYIGLITFGILSIIFFVISVSLPHKTLYITLPILGSIGVSLIISGLSGLIRSNKPSNNKNSYFMPSVLSIIAVLILILHTVVMVAVKNKFILHISSIMVAIGLGGLFVALDKIDTALHSCHANNNMAKHNSNYTEQHIDNANNLVDLNGSISDVANVSLCGRVHRFIYSKRIRYISLSTLGMLSLIGFILSAVFTHGSLYFSLSFLGSLGVSLIIFGLSRLILSQLKHNMNIIKSIMLSIIPLLIILHAVIIILFREKLTTHLASIMTAIVIDVLFLFVDEH